MAKVKLFGKSSLGVNLENEINEFLKQVIFIEYKTCDKYIHIIYDDMNSDRDIRRMVYKKDLSNCKKELSIEDYLKK